MMKKKLFALLLFLVFALPSVAFATDDAKAYVVLNDNTHTLTFYFDENINTFTGNANHVFDLKTKYDWGDFPQWTYSDYTSVVFDESMQNYAPTNTSFWFYSGSKTETIAIDFSNLNTNTVEYMDFMFYNCQNIETLDLSNFNTANVRSANCLFQGCSKLKTIYVDPNKWNLSNLENKDVFLFYNNPLLMGGEGTLWHPGDEYATIKYAHVDGENSIPGYFTSKTQTKPKVKSIAIKTAPTQLSYAINEPLKIDNKARITVTFENGRSVEQWLNCANITGYNADEKGSQTLSVKYYDQTTEFDIIVEKKVAPYYIDVSYLRLFQYAEYEPGYKYICDENLTKDDESKKNITDVIFQPSFKDYYPTSCANWFNRLTNLTTVSFNYNLNTDNVTDMSYMFSGCENLTSLNLLDFNTAKVTDMHGMFSGCSKLETIIVGPKWKTPAVTESSDMFYNCTSLKGGSGTVYNATKTNHTYAKIDKGSSSPGYFSKLDYTPYAVIDGNTLKFYYNDARPENSYSYYSDYYPWSWNLSITKVEFDPSFHCFAPTSCAKLFYGLMNLKEIEGLEYFYTSEITDMSYMFYLCNNLTSLDLSKFDTRKVTDMSGMFHICSKLKTIYAGENFQVGSNTITKELFAADYNLIGSKGTVYYYENIEQYDGKYAHIDGGDNNPGFFSAKGQTPPAVTSFSFVTMPQTSFNKMQTYNRGFCELAVTYEGRKPQSISIESTVVTGNYDSTKVGTYTKTLTYGGKSLTYNVTVEDNDDLYCSISSDNVLTLYYGKCQNDDKYFTQLPGSSFATKVTKVIIDESLKSYTNLTSCKEWFEFYYNLTEIEGLNNINTTNVTDMYGMFNQCNKLTTLDLSSFNTAKVTNMEMMFNGCQLLTSIYVGESWSTDAVTKDGSMFLDCNALVGGSGTAYTDTHVDHTYAKADQGASSPGYFTLKIINPYKQPTLNDNFYQIGDIDELLWFMYDVNHGNVAANAMLTQDIVINQDCLNKITEMLQKTSKAAPALIEWNPIGNSKNAFMGMFDGQGHTISGIYIKDETLDNVGLFGSVGSNAVIKNVGVVDSYIAGNENVGAICGKSEGTVANCYSTSIVSGAKNVGGVVGVVEEEAVVCNSYNLGTVTSQDGKSAGVCNTASENAVVENCYYLAETPIADDPQAKTAEQFKSGEVAQLLSKEVEIKGVTYTNEIANNVTELPGMEEIEQRNNPDNPSTPVAKIANVDSNIKVWSYNSTIFIESLPNTEYRIIDLNGRLITTSTTKSTREEIRVNQKGVLVVIIGNNSYKVLN